MSDALLLQRLEETARKLEEAERRLAEARNYFEKMETVGCYCDTRESESCPYCSAVESLGKALKEESE